MPRPADRASVVFTPPLPLQSHGYDRVQEILTTMNLWDEVVIYHVGNHDLSMLNFPTGEQAMLFRLVWA